MFANKPVRFVKPLCMIGIVSVVFLSFIVIDPRLAWAAVPAIRTVKVGLYPIYLAANPTTDTFYVEGTKSVPTTDWWLSAINITTDKVIGPAELGAYPSAIAVNPTTDTVYAANETSVSVINGATDKIIHVIRVESSGLALAVNSRTNMIYVGGLNSISVISGTTDKVTTAIGFDSVAQAIAVNPTTDTVYAENATSVSVINGATDKVIHVIPVNPSGVGLAVDPTTNMVYLAGRHNEYDAYYGEGYANTITVINGATDKVVRNIDVNDNTSGIEDIEVDPATGMILANDSESVTMINGATDKVVRTVPIHTGCLALDPRTGVIYSEAGKRSVSVIALATGSHSSTSSSGFWLAGIGLVIVAGGGALLPMVKRRRTL